MKYLENSRWFTSSSIIIAIAGILATATGDVTNDFHNLIHFQNEDFSSSAGGIKAQAIWTYVFKMGKKYEKAWIKLHRKNK